MKQRILIIIAAVVFLAGIVGCVLVMNAPKKNRVQIRSGAEVLYTLDLTNERDRTIEIKTADGVNIIEIKDAKIRVQSADCPDQTCVRMGWLSSAAMPIVCLPHHLVIEFVEPDSGVDTITE